MLELNACITSRANFSAFTARLEEQHTQEHARRRLRFYSRLLRLQDLGSVAGIFGSTPADVKFSSFSDPNGYAGFVPTIQFIIDQYIAFTTKRRPVLDRAMQMILAKHLSIDHSFKVTKRCPVRHVKYFLSLWTASNEHNEIMSQRFCIGKSTAESQDAMAGLARRYEARGLEGPDLLTTDICCQDRPMALRMFASLR
jgi:hypothetical protein